MKDLPGRSNLLPFDVGPIAVDGNLSSLAKMLRPIYSVYTLPGYALATGIKEKGTLPIRVKWEQRGEEAVTAGCDPPVETYYGRGSFGSSMRSRPNVQ